LTQRLVDHDAAFVTPADTLAELREDSLALAGLVRASV
jgi:starvation-inducible DNA-binding protein